MATLMQGASLTIEERLSGGIRESLPRLDPVYKYIADTWFGVASTNDVGRSWQVNHTFNESLHGVFKWVTAGGSNVNNTTLTHSLIPTDVQEYPGLEDTTLPGYLRKTITLVAGMGNLFLPQTYARADQLSAEVGSLVTDLLRGAATLTALADIACFYSVGVPSQIGVAGNSTSGTSVNVVVLGAVNQFYNGQHVDIYTTTTKINTNYQVVVDGVRYIPATTDTTGYGVVTLKSKDGASTVTVTAGDLIVIQDSFNVGPHGPFHWLINTGSAYGINVGTYQQFQSVVQTSVGDLDETKLARYFQRLWKAYGTMNFPDTVLTSMGVTIALLDSSYGLTDRFVRNLGERNQLVMGFQSAGESAYMFNGIPIRWIESPYMPSDSQFAGTANGGRLWALKMRDKNIKRYLPPPLPGAKKNAMFGREAEFPFGTGGPSGMFSPYHSSAGRKTNWMEAPFNRWSEYAPDYMPGLNLSGINEIL